MCGEGIRILLTINGFKNIAKQTFCKTQSKYVLQKKTAIPMETYCSLRQKALLRNQHLLSPLLEGHIPFILGKLQPPHCCIVKNTYLPNNLTKSKYDLLSSQTWPGSFHLNNCSAHQFSSVTCFQLVQTLNLGKGTHSKKVDYCPSYTETYDVVCFNENWSLGSCIKKYVVFCF